MENILGFYVLIDRGENLNHTLENQDDFSSAKYVNEQDHVTAFVQAGVNSLDSARKLANEYCKNKSEFTPDRYTEGSFLIIDSVNGRIIAGRDRSQAYKLYIFEDDNKIHITTDISVICGTVCKELDAKAIDLFLLHGIVLAPFPLLKGVKSVLPGQYSIYDNTHSGDSLEFWRIQKVDVPKDYDEAVAKYGELFLKSIERNLSGNNAAVFLSGGSDSATVMGALNKLEVENITAAHIAIKNNFPFEREDVKTLQQAYGFDLRYVKPDYWNSNWSKQVKQSLLSGSINSIYISFPTYVLMGKQLGNDVPAGTTVYNGDWCLLDQGFSDSSDRTRSIRRWLFTGGGRYLPKMFPILPESATVKWSEVRKHSIIRQKWRDKLYVLKTTLQTVLHSVGRPADFYAGLKLGFRGFPGIWSGLTLLPADYENNLRSAFLDNFFNRFTEELKGDEWKQAIATMTTNWYSESSLFTMPPDAAGMGKMNMCLPFSSVDLMDFAASLPLEWTIDKKIQKDMCKRVFNMPDEVAYRMKNHKQSFSYFDTVYGEMKEEMEVRVLETDFGPLNEGIRSLNKSGKLQGQSLISLFGLSLWMEKYNLKVS